MTRKSALFQLDPANGKGITDFRELAAGLEERGKAGLLAHGIDPTTPEGLDKAGELTEEDPFGHVAFLLRLYRAALYLRLDITNAPDPVVMSLLIDAFDLGTLAVAERVQPHDRAAIMGHKIKAQAGGGGRQTASRKRGEIERRREFIAECLRQTNLSGGALVAWLEKQIVSAKNINTVGQKTIRNDLKALKNRG